MGSVGLPVMPVTPPISEEASGRLLLPTIRGGGPIVQVPVGPGICGRDLSTVMP